MSIREAKETDALDISSLVKSLAHFYLNNPNDALPEWLAYSLTEDAFLERISSDDFVNYVYEDKNKIIGFISLKKPNHIYHLFVDEQHQGKGISRLLWQHLLSNNTFDSITLRSSIYAIPIYKRFGFKETDTIGIKDGVSFQPMALNLND